MGQKDPATEWQREGFEIFGQMLESIDNEFVRYVMHVEVKEKEPEQPPQDAGIKLDPKIIEVPSERKDASVQPAQLQPDQVKAAVMKARADRKAGATTAKAAAPAGGDSEPAKAEAAPAPAPKVNDEFENVGRNERCPCGSGSKFKHCHGR